MSHDHDHEHPDAAGEHSDEWFRHTPDEPDAQHAHGEIRPGVIIGFLAAVIVATFGVAVLFLVYFTQVTRELQDDRWDGRTDFLASEYNERRANWNAELNGQPEWADMEQTFVTVPLSDAMDAVIEQYNRDR